MSEVYSSFSLSRAPGPELWFSEQCVPTFSPFDFTNFRSTRNLSRIGSLLREFEPGQMAERGSLGISQAIAWCGSAFGGGSYPSANGGHGMQSGTWQVVKLMRSAKARVATKDDLANGGCQYVGSGDVFPVNQLLCGPEGRGRGLKSWR